MTFVDSLVCMYQKTKKRKYEIFVYWKIKGNGSKCNRFGTLQFRLLFLLGCMEFFAAYRLSIPSPTLGDCFRICGSVQGAIL